MSERTATIPASAPVIGSFKGNPTISLDTGNPKYPFSFGLSKAKAICRDIEAIKAFVASNGEGAQSDPGWPANPNQY